MSQEQVSKQKVCSDLLFDDLKEVERNQVTVFFFYRCQSGFLKISILNARWLMKVRQATFIICHYEFSCVPLLGIDG